MPHCPTRCAIVAETCAISFEVSVTVHVPKRIRATESDIPYAVGDIKECQTFVKFVKY